MIFVRGRIEMMITKNVLRFLNVALALFWLVPGLVFFGSDGLVIWGISGLVMIGILEAGEYIEGKFEDDSNDN
jgi:hypothetical protein